jgi:small subunit ribosomal protein S9
MAQMAQRWYATGRRKTATARVYLKEGSGRFIINKRDFDDYFPREIQRMVVVQPLQVTNLMNRFDVLVNVRGGGLMGQAGAILHGISRGLLTYDPELRESLKRQGFLTRDARKKERKKYGLRGARAKFQFSKR